MSLSRKIILCSTIYFSLSNFVFSQQDTLLTVEDVLNMILDEATIEKEDSQLYDLIEQLLENPININIASKNEILSIPFMDVESAQIIIDYRNKHGRLFSTSEIELIVGLNSNVSSTLKYFIKVSDAVELDSPPYLGFYSLKFRSRIIQDAQERIGFTDSVYEGSKIKAYNRIKLHLNPKISVGGLIEKDSGEKLYWDFYSANIFLNNLLPSTNIVLGDFTVEFGQGLSMWSPYSFSKSSDATNTIIKRARSISPYTSSGETNFLRGAAFNTNIFNFNFTAFYSDLKLDATLSDVGSFSSIKLDGYHRTVNEIFRSDNVNDKTYGANLSYSFFNVASVGVLYYEKLFNNKFVPINFPNISNDQFQFASITYDFVFKQILFIGELSYFQDSYASINTIQLSLVKNFILTAIIRNYPKNYFSFYSNGFGEKSTTNNEFGVYTGFKWQTNIGIINFYFDQFKFPSISSQMPLPSKGDELSFSYENKFTRELRFYLRYFNENKEVLEIVERQSQIINQKIQKIRGEITFFVNPEIRLKSRLELLFLNLREISFNETGFLIFQDINITFPIKLSIMGRIIFFQTDSYASRIYEFENDLTGVMTNLPLYGTGMRWYFVIRYRPIDIIQLSLKYSELYKPNENSIGSAYNTIIGNIDNRISLQADISF